MNAVALGMASLCAWLIAGSGDDRRRQWQAAAVIGAIDLTVVAMWALMS